MRRTTDAYIPALRFHWLTRYYDPLLRAPLRERRFKARLVRQVSLEAGERALDLGCGTGTLTAILERAYPGAHVVGLDADPAALAIARPKVAAVDLCVGSAVSPPFAAGSFDRIVSSLLFHHLTSDEKRRALRATLALLRPDGELHVVNWDRARDLAMRLAFLGVQLLDGFRTTADTIRGHLPRLIAEAGFAPVAETYRLRTGAPSRSSAVAQPALRYASANPAITGRGGPRGPAIARRSPGGERAGATK